MHTKTGSRGFIGYDGMVNSYLFILKYVLKNTISLATDINTTVRNEVCVNIMHLFWMLAASALAKTDYARIINTHPVVIYGRRLYDYSIDIMRQK